MRYLELHGEASDALSLPLLEDRSELGMTPSHVQRRSVVLEEPSPFT
jgi:hypothetical protein